MSNKKNEINKLNIDTNNIKNIKENDHKNIKGSNESDKSEIDVSKLYNKNICVICSKEIPKSELNEALRLDTSGFIMQSIIKFKKMLHIYHGNKLYVCKKHIPRYMTERNKFLKSQYILWAVIGFLALFVFVIPLFSGEFNWDSLVLLIILSIILYLLIFLRGYYPPLLPKQKPQKIPTKQNQNKLEEIKANKAKINKRKITKKKENAKKTKKGYNAKNRKTKRNNRANVNNKYNRK